MLTIDCPWCDQPLAVDDGDTVRCDDCSVELSFAPEPATPVVALAA